MYLEIKELNIYMDLAIEKEKYKNKQYLADLFDSIANTIIERANNV